MGGGPVVPLGSTPALPLGQCAEAKACLEGADIVYTAGFFLTVSVPAIVRAGKHCLTNGKTMCLNLSAPFIVQFFGAQLAEVMPYVDILFGNEDEAREYAKANDWGTEDVSEIAKKCVTLPKEVPPPPLGDHAAPSEPQHPPRPRPPH